MPQEGLVRSDEFDHIAVLTLNRPGAMNAINAEMSAALGDAVCTADRHPDIRVIVVTGTGRAFCAGADLKALARGESIADERHPERGFAGFVRQVLDKPVIAAVNGFALAGGTEIVLACDLAIAEETATFGLPEVTRGLFAAAGGAFRLAAQIPQKMALELALTGGSIDAHRALALGMVNHVVPEGHALDAALSLASAIAANAPLAVQATKRVARGASDGRIANEADSWISSSRESEAIRRSEDFHEGTAAFAEKRPPHWRGR